MDKVGIIFDLDGTLWDASAQVVSFWNLTLSRYKALEKEISIEDMRSFTGKSIDAIAQIMFPKIELKDSIKILKECCSEEQEYLRKNGGMLYSNLEETLKALTQDYSLYIVSNCQDGYVQAFLDYHNLWDYFSDFETLGRTGKNKGENIKLILNRNNLKKAVYVGATVGDLVGAKYAGIPFIYAEYGFGKLDVVKKSIKSISEISSIVEKVFK